MEAVSAARQPIRPACPRHPGSRVRLDGYVRCGWSDAHRRPRYRCVTEPRSRGHAFSLAVPVRQPTEHHPDSGVACPRCEHVFERHEGIRTGIDFTFGHQEIARLFVRLGEGMSLREASSSLRRSVFRLRDGETSRQANLAVNYLDAFAPTVIEALHPRTWPAAIVVDATTLMTRGYRPLNGARAAADADADEGPETRVGNLKAGTILFALDATGRHTVPCLIQAQGGKDVESWKTFFRGLEGAPGWVVADLDPAVARAVRERWPSAVLYHSRHHIAELLRDCARADGIPERVELATAIVLSRPIPWAPDGRRTRRYGEHPLFSAIEMAQRGPESWAAFVAAVEEHVPPERLALRSWIATNELLIERQWRLEAHWRLEHQTFLPRSTGGLEGRLGEWLAPLRRRAGRWQNVRRLNLVLGLITLGGRGQAHEARYAALIRARFGATAERSHLPLAVVEDEAAGGPPISWWRTWHDRDGASLPRLVRDAERRTRRREEDDHLQRLRRRLAEIYAVQNDLRAQYGIAVPPRGRPRRPTERMGASVRGKVVADFPALLAEWAWDHNGDLDPATLPAAGRQRVAWRCCLTPAHVWETRVADRTGKPSYCPYHMGNRVHPSESLAAYYPWLAAEWHPTLNELRPDQVTRASGREVVWRCGNGHEWRAAVYARTLTASGCPSCYTLEAGARSRAGKRRARQARAAETDAPAVR
jgi:putative zinc ribbon protein